LIDMGSRRLIAMILIFASGVSCLTMRGASAPMVAVVESNADLSTFTEAFGGNESSVSDNADAIILPATGNPADRRVTVLTPFSDPVAFSVRHGRRYRGPPHRTT